MRLTAVWSNQLQTKFKINAVTTYLALEEDNGISKFYIKFKILPVTLFVKDLRFLAIFKK